MTLYKSLLTAACVTLVPLTAYAAPIAAGDYIAKDYNDYRSIWTPNGGRGPSSDAFVQGGSSTAYWSFSDDSVFSYDGSSASLSGLATNTGADDLSFDFELNFDVSLSGNTAYCQQAGAGSDHDCADTDAGIDPSDWTFFSLTSASLTGVVGSALEGISYVLDSNPDHNPQAGEAANALDEEGLGFSMWFTWKKDGDAVNDSVYSFNDGGRGDINIDLDPTGGGGGGGGGLTPVPLPAAGWLLLASFGGLAAMRRKKG